jgi:hypothetical protein
MPEYTEFVHKTQTEILNAVKAAQETNLKAMTSFGEALVEYANKAKSLASVGTLPTPAEMIETSFGFTAQLVELQKNYYVRVAETIAAAQKKATETAAVSKKADK